MHRTLCALLVLTLGAPAMADGYDMGASRSLKVLYAGVPGSPRETAFLALLRAAFATVDATDLTTLSMRTAAGYDVVVADGRRLYPMREGEGLATTSLALGPEFTKPIIAISAVAGTIQHHTKIDWL